MIEFDGRKRVIIEGVSPSVDGGRFPAKRVIGDQVAAEADVFADGHDLISAVLSYRHETEKKPRRIRMRPLANDRWRAEFVVDTLGFYTFSIEAWIDHFLTWHRDLRKRVDARSDDLEVQLQIGLQMMREAAGRSGTRDRKKLQSFIAALESDEAIEDRIEDMWSEDLLELMFRNGERRFAARLEREMTIEVDRRKALYSTWYELFPRSAGDGRHGTFRDVERQLPRIAAMGFDVLYLPPVHPIGTTFRKGRNNQASARENDVGSPWAIGAAEGGHRDVHPLLGSMQDLEQLVKAAAGHGIEVALDIAFQASPDHPYVREHREWFRSRPDGTIQYAENPPKQYQDIYPFDFESEQWQALWDELLEVLRFWSSKGIKIFRVDNPHTKPLRFWQWVITELKREQPDLIFLAEAFTRPRIVEWLAKGGFSQSYTYFAWRNTAYELRRYFQEITRPPVSDFFRPNVWPNTPDILTEYLQYGGKPAFVIRFVLAATLSASYGLYGPAFERYEHRAREAGSEEYLDSEKYEVRRWEPTGEDMTELMTLVNRVRRENASLHQNATLHFHESENDSILCYSKSAGENIVLCVVSVDPHNQQSGWIELDLDVLQLESGKAFQVHDLLSGVRHSWHGARNFVQLNPHVVPANIFRIRRRVRTERDFEYYL